MRLILVILITASLAACKQISDFSDELRLKSSEKVWIVDFLRVLEKIDSQVKKIM